MQDITIKVNEKNIPLSEFPAKFIKNSINGMLRTLKDIEKIETVEIKYQN